MRLTGSGLGCADWPKCSETKFVDVSTGHAAIEQLNRLFTGVVALTVILCVLLSLRLKPRRKDLIGMSAILIVGVLLQVIIGAVVVLTGLNPLSNIAHFLVSIFLMTIAYMLVRHAAIFRLTRDVVPRGSPLIGDKKVLTTVKVLVGATLLAVITGTVVTGSGPHAGDENAVRINLAMKTIVKVHSATVWIAVATLLVLIFLGGRNVLAKSLLRRSLTRFGAVVVFQGLVGYSQYFLGLPVILVAVHVATAVAVWLCALDIYWNSRLSEAPTNVKE